MNKMNSPQQRWVAISVAVLFLPMFVIGCSGSRFGARTTPVTASIKGQLFDRLHLVDAGNTTPEAALESSFWASANGNFDADVAFYTPNMQDEVKRWNGGRIQFATDMERKFARFKSLQITARKSVEVDKVELHYQFEFEGPPARKQAGPAGKIAVLVNLHGAWKCAETKSHTTDWDDGSTPEPM
jgi:hypothetical protein